MKTLSDDASAETLSNVVTKSDFNVNVNAFSSFSLFLVFGIVS